MAPSLDVRNGMIAKLQPDQLATISGGVGRIGKRLEFEASRARQIVKS